MKKGVVVTPFLCFFALFVLESIQSATEELHVLCDILVERIGGT